jgi:hypothetical protein
MSTILAAQCTPPASHSPRRARTAFRDVQQLPAEFHELVERQRVPYRASAGRGTEESVIAQW